MRLRKKPGGVRHAELVPVAPLQGTLRRGLGGKKQIHKEKLLDAAVPQSQRKF